MNYSCFAIDWVFKDNSKVIILEDDTLVYEYKTGPYRLKGINDHKREYESLG